jgi:hypothetical protein
MTSIGDHRAAFDGEDRQSLPKAEWRETAAIIVTERNGSKGMFDADVAKTYTWAGN